MANAAARFLFRIADLLRKIGKNISKKDRQWYTMLADWHRQDAARQFRTNYEGLGPDSVVFDLGGYQGQWAGDIFARYLCQVHVFEPHPDFAGAIADRFKQNQKIRVYDFGLGAKDERVKLSTQADATSIFKKGGRLVEVEIKNVKTFWEAHQIETIDLMKINIEGAEYDLLSYLLDTQLISRIKNIQVQFHHFVPDAEKQMQKIQKELERTHYPTYQFTFLWENWRLKERP